MKISFSVLVLLISVTLCAQNSSIPSVTVQNEQGKMRGYFRDSYKIFSSLERELTPKFQTEQDSSSVDNIRVQYQNVLQRIQSIEGPVQIQDSVSGRSLIWAHQNKSANYELGLDNELFRTGPEGDVILFNGEFTQTMLDMSYPQRGGICFSFRRYYSSEADYDGSLGIGWDFSYNAHLVFDKDSPDDSLEASLFLNGRKISFTKKGIDWQSQKGVFLHLRYESGAYCIYDSQLRRMEFEPSSEVSNGWRLKAIASRHNHYSVNRVSISYQEKTDRIAFIIEPYGNKISVCYDQTGKIVQIASSNQSVSYTYNRSGHLETVSFADAALNFNEKSCYRIKYEYTSVSGRNLLTSRRVNDSPSVYSIAYDPDGKVSANGYKSNDKNAMWSIRRNGNIVTVIPAQPAAMIQYVFGSTICHSLPSEIRIPSLKSTEQYIYNSDGLIIEHLDSVGVKTSYEYDSGNSMPELHANLVRKITYPSPRIEPNANGKIVTEQSFLQGTSFPEKVVLYEDDEKNVLSVQSYEYSEDNHNLVCLTDNGIPTRYFYNKYGAIAIILDANNNATIRYYASSWPNGSSLNFVDGKPEDGGLLVAVFSDVPQKLFDEVSSKLGGEKYRYSDLIRVSPVSIQTQYAYNEQGEIIHSKTGTKESFSLFNRNGDALATWDSQEGNTLFSLSKQYLPQEIFHQFTPGTTTFQGSTTPLFTGSYYRENIIRDSMNQIESVSKTDERFNGMAAVYTYSRYPNGTMHTVTDPMGITRVDEYGDNGLLLKQYLRNGEALAELKSDFAYYPNGEIRSYTDVFGEKNSSELDRYGRLAIMTNSLGVKTTTIFDGVGHIREERSEKDGKVIARKEYLYDRNSLLSSVYEHRIAEDMDEKILTKKMEYDKNGNVIASRGVHDNSWEHFLYDGLNRTVVHKYPSGDYVITVYKDDQICMTRQMDYEDQNNYRSQGMFFVRDVFGNPVVSIPTDSEDKLQYDKSLISKYGIRSLVVSSKRPELNNEVKEYNTLGQIVLEKTIPLSEKYGEKEIVTKYSYLPNGNIYQKRTENYALGIYGSNDNASASMFHAPQITTYVYDNLGREHSICQPDGLIVEKHYDVHSMPIGMIWKHVTAEQNVLRHLRLTYGKQGRLHSISDAKTNTLLRTYLYDDYGNRIKENDGDVTVFRKFDSMGLLLSEQTSVGAKSLPGFTVKYSLHDGTEALTWNNIVALSNKNWRTQTVVRDAANRIESMRLDQSTTDFVKWKYLGSIESERRIQDSRITQRNTFNKCNELSKSSFWEGSSIFENPTLFGEISYIYDVWGNEICSTTSLAKSSYTYAQYMDYNSIQQIVAQNSEINLPAPEKAMDRRRQVLGTASLQSQKTIRMAYDQVDNIWANYHGHAVSFLKPESFSMDNLSSFVSPAGILSGSLSDKDLLDLASNRETTNAVFSDSKLTAEENEYDKLGNLIRFKGEFWNKNRALDVVWHLTFDSLGRLVFMKGIADSDTKYLNKGDIAAELIFKYDAANRRIYKEVKDYSHSKTDPIPPYSEWTVYYGNSQSLVLDKNDSVTGQYLWKPDSRELLMAALPQNIAENTATFRTERYYFQQDRGFNTVCVTKIENGRAVLVSAASYMCFGKNTTMAKIKTIESSMSCSNATIAYNNSLDDSSNPAIWKGQRSRLHFMTIHLSEKSDLSYLNIWTDSSFPKNFLAFVLPSNESSPGIGDSSEAVDSFCSNMQGDYLAYVNKSNIPFTSSNAIHIPLQNLPGNKIVLVWNSDETNEIHINELEVGRIPGNPGAIAFAGQWLDRETNLYYQINRYKLAGSNKFISPDPIGFMDGNNLYAYAKNNPLSWHDPNGEWVHILLGAVVGAAINSGVYAIQCWITGEDFSWKELAIRAGTGALAGGIAAATFGAVNPLLTGAGMNALAVSVVSNAAAGAAGGFTYGVADSAFHGGGVAESLTCGLEDAAWGALSGAVFGVASHYVSQWSSASTTNIKDGTTKLSQTISAGKNAPKIQHGIQMPDTGNKSSIYSRPSGYRTGVRDAVWEMAIEPSTGRVRDPLTGRFMSKNAPWDMGHKPGYEWWKFKKHAEAWGLSRKQVLDWNNNPNHFRPELPSSNRSHLAEDLTSAFFGL